MYSFYFINISIYKKITKIKSVIFNWSYHQKTREPKKELDFKKRNI